MKNRISRISLFVAAGVLGCLPSTPSLAADNSPTTAQPTATQPAVAAAAPSGASATTAAPAATASAPVKLPYGVEDVLKLSRAQINEEIIVNYIQNSGTIYTLAPQEIVYLRNEGVSDRVVNTMLDQRKVVAAEAAAQTAAAAAPAPQTAAYPDTGAVAAAPIYAPPYCQPACAEVELAPSTVYVIPYPQARAAFYRSYQPSSYVYYGGYYGGYGGYCGPGASSVYGVGGRGYYGGHHHGWHHH